MLKRYTVMYRNPSDDPYRDDPMFMYFDAEDEVHAEEQFRNAEPKAVLMEVQTDDCAPELLLAHYDRLTRLQPRLERKRDVAYLQTLREQVLHGDLLGWDTSSFAADAAMKFLLISWCDWLQESGNTEQPLELADRYLSETIDHLERARELIKNRRPQGEW